MTFAADVQVNNLIIILAHTFSGPVTHSSTKLWNALSVDRMICWTLLRIIFFNPSTAGAAYMRVFIFYEHIGYYLLNMLKIKCDINQQYLKTVSK